MNDVLNVAITIICMAILVCVWFMLYDTNRFVIREHTFQDKRIKKKVRAVMLADLHNKEFGKNNEHLLEAIRLAKPDLILIAGDILTAKPGAKPDVAIHFIKELARDYPIYYGNGNHEHRLKLYPEKYGDMGKRYEEALEAQNVQPMVNSHVELKEWGITVFGSEIDRFYYRRFKVQHMEPDYLESILGQPVKDTYNILLAHNPDYFPQYVSWGADLVCSGHVHGGMVRIPFVGKGVVSPNVKLFPKYDGGKFTKENTTMLLSRGLGTHTIPVRLFNPGELLIINLEPENTSFS